MPLARVILGELRDGRFDAVIGTSIHDPDYVCRPLFSETLWTCAAADDALSQSKEPVSLSDLSDKPLLSSRWEFRLAEIVDRLAHLAGTYVSRDYQGASFNAVRQIAVMGLALPCRHRSMPWPKRCAIRTSWFGGSITATRARYSFVMAALITHATGLSGDCGTPHDDESENLAIAARAVPVTVKPVISIDSPRI